MTKHKGKSALATLGLILSLLLLPACDREGASGATASRNAKSELIAEVAVATPQRKSFERTFVASGTLSGTEKAVLRVLADGPLDEISVEIGDRVAAGAALVQTRPTEAQLRLQSAEAALDVARANWIGLKAWRRDEEVAMQRALVVEARATLERIRLDAKRTKRLVEEGASPEASWDNARTRETAASAALQMAEEQLSMAETGASLAETNLIESQVKQSQAALAEAQQMLDDTTLHAPFDGVITGKYLKAGDYARRGEEVLELTDLSILEAEFPLPERYSLLVRNGAKVSIDLPAVGMTAVGQIVAVNAAIDSASRTFLTKVAVENPDGRIKTGSFCTGRFDLPTVTDALAVPQVAVVAEEGRSYLWTSANGRAHRVEVELGDEDSTFVQVVAGVDENTPVVISGAGILTEGAELSVRQATEAAE